MMMSNQIVLGVGRRLATAAAALVLTCVAAGVAAQPASLRENAITPTRFVKLFYGIERQLLDAQDGNKQDVLKSLLAEDFVQRSGAAPLGTVARDDWIDQARAMAPRNVMLNQMAVHEQGDLAIASFLMMSTGAANRFVVDIWRKKGAEEQYELLTRYVSEVAAPAVAKPAAKPVTKPATGKVLPDGKG